MNAVDAGYVSMVVCLSQLSNLPDGVIIKLCPMVLHTQLKGPMRSSIVHVLGMCRPSQVFAIHATKMAFSAAVRRLMI